MRQFILFIIILCSINISAKSYALTDTTKRKTAYLGLEVNLVSYQNTNVNGLNNFFSGYGYQPLSGESISAGMGLGFYMDHFTGFASFSGSVADNSEANTGKYMQLQNTYIKGGLFYDLLHYKRFSLPLGIEYLESNQILSLIDKDQLGSTFTQAAGNPSGEIVLHHTSYSLGLGIKPTFILYNKPSMVINRITFSVSYSWYYNFANDGWQDISYNKLAGGLNNQFNSWSVGLLSFAFYTSTSYKGGKSF